MKTSLKIALIALSATMFTGCAVAKTTGKVAALPFKAAYKTTEFAAKGAYKTTELAAKGVMATGKGVYKTTEFAAKGVMATGKGIYYVGSVPVKITDKALDTTSKVLTLTTQMLDAGGKAVTLTRQIKATQLNAELAAVRSASNILSVVVDAFG